MIAAAAVVSQIACSGHCIHMSNAYQGLVRTGYVSSQKRDILLEASRDLEYIGNIPFRFANAGAKAAREPIACAVQLIGDLVDMGFCSLATWSGYDSARTVIQRTRAELEVHLAECERGQHTFELFLVATPLGDEWVRRYLTLVAELDTARS
jgi:hypothetical protein